MAFKDNLRHLNPELQTYEVQQEVESQQGHDFPQYFHYIRPQVQSYILQIPDQRRDHTVIIR
jgi:hypothetical protein